MSQTEKIWFDLEKSNRVLHRNVSIYSAKQRHTFQVFDTVLQRCETLWSFSTCHFQQPVSQGAFSMVDMGNDAEIPDFVHRELGQVDSILRNNKEQLTLLTLKETY